MNRILKDINGNNCGIVGDVTNMTYEDGSFMQVGDVVETRVLNYFWIGFVIKKNDNYFIIFDFDKSKYKLGKCGVYNVNLIKKCYDVEIGEVHNDVKVTEESPYHTITIDGKDIKISEESFKELKRQLVEE